MPNNLDQMPKNRKKHCIKNNLVNFKNQKPKNRSKISQALDLPKICNINPRSIYNSVKQFTTFVKQHEIDLIFMSESWERENLTLSDIINLKDYQIISNVFQRKGRGGRPALFANKNKLNVCELST